MAYCGSTSWYGWFASSGYRGHTNLKYSSFNKYGSYNKYGSHSKGGKHEHDSHDTHSHQKGKGHYSHGNGWGYGHHKDRDHKKGGRDKIDARDDAVTVDEDSTATVNVLDNDSGRRGDLKVKSFEGFDAGETAILETDGGRLVEVTINADGTATATMISGSETLDAGETDQLTISYQVSGGRCKTDGADLVITFNGSNDGPVFTIEDDAFSLLENETLNANVLANDESDAGLVVTSAGGVDAGVPFTVTSEDGRTGTVVVDADGSITFTADGEFDTLAVGQSDSITFSYTAGTAGGTGENLIINGDFENNPLNNTGWNVFDTIVGWTSPVGLIEVQESNFGTGNTQGNAIVELDSHGANSNSTIQQIVTIPDAGSYTLSVDYAARGTNFATNGFDIIVNGEVVSQVRPTQSGFQTEIVELDLAAGNAVIQFRAAGTQDTFGTVIDNVELRSSAVAEDLGDATVTIVIDGVNDNPDAIGETASTNEALDGSFQAATLNVLANDSDIDDGDVLTVVAAGNGGVVGQPFTVNSDTNGFAATVVLNADGTLTVSPGAGFSALNAGQSDTITVNYVVGDGNGGTANAQAVVTVNGADNGITAADDSVTVFENDQAQLNVLANDNGAGLSVTSINGHNAGTPFLATTDGGRQLQVLVNAAGVATIVAGTAFDNLAFGQEDTVRLNYTATDGSTSDDAFIDVTIVGINDDIRIFVNEDNIAEANQGQVGTEQKFIVTSNGLPGLVDVDGDAAVFSVVQQGTFVTATVDPATGVFSFSGAPGFIGTDSFVFEVSDGLSTDSATIEVLIINANFAPTIDAIASDLTVGASIVGDFLSASGILVGVDIDDLDFGANGQQFPDDVLDMEVLNGVQITATGVDDVELLQELLGEFASSAFDLGEFNNVTNRAEFNFNLETGEISELFLEEGLDAAALANASVELVYTVRVLDQNSAFTDSHVTVQLGAEDLVGLFV